MDLSQIFSTPLDPVSLLLGFFSGSLIIGGVIWGRLKARTAELTQQTQKLMDAEVQLNAQAEQLAIQQAQVQEQEVAHARLEERLTTLGPLQNQNQQLNEELTLAREEVVIRSQDFAELETRLEERSAQLDLLRQNAKELAALAEKRQQDLSARNNAFAELKTRLDAERQAHADKLRTLEEARDQLKTEFQNLANKIFEEKSAKFSQTNQEGLGHILNPLRQQLGDFRKRVEDVYDREAKDRRSLYEQIGHLKQLNQQMSQDAVNLTNALKGESKTQGNWGEVILERVLEESGLRRGHEFETQVSLSESGKRYQPDVIVHLPDNKDVIVDAKVSLTAYERYCSTENDQQRQQFLREHLQSLRGHVRGLSDKAYQGLEGVRSLDFVLLFIPVEGAFMLALENDHGLFNDAFERNIMLVSPATLLVTLRTIHNIWRYEHQSQNAREIAKRGGELHDKFVGFVEAMDDIGRHIERTRQAYDTATNRLSKGRGNLVNQAAMLNQLGASGKKKLPESLLETAFESALETSCGLDKADAGEEAS